MVDINNLINSMPRQKMPVQSEFSKPIPESMWRDSQIRHGIAHAVQLDDEQVLEITKMLQSDNIQQLEIIQLDRPFALPTACGDNYGSNNQDLKNFAFDVYDQLSYYFRLDSWRGWFLAPYFSHGDDLRESFNLGLFVDETFIETVVE